MSLKLFRCILVMMLLPVFTFAQNSLSAEERIAAIPKNYFEMPRENFHLQLNKSMYLSNETIWLKGFVFTNVSSQPSLGTTNVYVSFFDPKGEKLLTKLLYAKNGTFDGDFPIPENFSSGTYYLQVSTNWANNFSEDESALFAVTIVNTTEGQKRLASAEPQVTFNPEGGSFVAGVKNSIGIKITDCSLNGIAVTDGKVLNSNGTEITAFQTNAHGYGKFDLPNTSDTSYQVRFTHKGTPTDVSLPRPEATGIAMVVNNFTNEAKTFVQLSTNQQTSSALQGKRIFLAIQQFDKMNLVAIEDLPLDKTIVLPSKDLFDGINTIHIIDADFKELNQRIIYKPSAKSFKLALEVSNIAKDSITVRGISAPQAQLAVSVLATGSLAAVQPTSIYNSLLVHPYLKESVPNITEYLKNPSRKNWYDLDVILLNQQSKYNWDQMKTPPQPKFPFNTGVTLRGTINENLPDKKNYRIQMYSLFNGINEMVEINDKNEFYFKNIIVHDSLKVNFTLVKDGSKYKELNYYPSIVNDDKPFLKKFMIKQPVCSAAVPIDQQSEIVFPALADAFALDDVVIQNEAKKPQLTNKLRIGNSMMRGYKITDSDYKMYTNVIQFLAANGFDAGQQNGNVYIRGRTRHSITRPNIPVVFLDDVQILDFSVLDNMLMTYVDEIYINRNGTTIQSTGGGVIKIYSNTSYKARPIKTKAKSYTISGAFAEKNKFVLPIYTSYDDNGFKQFGTIFWNPTLNSENGAVLFKIPNLQQKEVQILVEGINADGQLLSETHTITIN